MYNEQTGIRSTIEGEKTRGESMRRGDTKSREASSSGDCRDLEEDRQRWKRRYHEREKQKRNPNAEENSCCSRRRFVHELHHV